VCADTRKTASAPQDARHTEIQALISRRDFAKADAVARSMLKREPDSSDAHYFIGVIHYLQGQIGQAVENLKRALSLEPHHTDAAVCLSVLFNDIGKYDEARRVFEQANQSVAHRQLGDDAGIDLKFAVKHLELADLYFRYRRYDEAIEEYARAAALDPSTLEIRIRLAKAYARKGFLTRAVQELQALKKEQPGYLPARIQLGLLFYSQGNLLEAELEWEAVIELDPTHREARAYLDMAKPKRLQ
jgi:tetratricopeptide (TPR) repeat protein